MKRSFRIATAFTGVATVALAPTAAHAATTAQHARAEANGYITAFDCGPNSPPDGSSQWLHLYYSKKENHSTAACVDGQSGSPIYTIGKGKRFAYYCAGKYSGYLWVNGEKDHFTQGRHNLYNASVSKVQVTGSPYGQYSSCLSRGSVYPG